MALIRWQPFHEMDALQRDMNRMFEALASSDRNSMRHFVPLAEMEQTKDAVHLRYQRNWRTSIHMLTKYPTANFS